MLLIPLKTPRLNSGQALFPVLEQTLKGAQESLREKDVLILASKVVAYQQARLVDFKDQSEFREWVKQEADRILDEGDMILTLKNKMLIPNAGIDTSNTPEGQGVLWPEQPFEFAQAFRQQLKETYGLKEVGVLISDSHCQPLRQGTSGLAIGWAGFQGVQDERGSVDLFGRKMQYTQIAVADNLASAALLEMGETNASIPLVIARRAPIRFTEKRFCETDATLPPDQCLYKPLYGEKLA